MREKRIHFEEDQVKIMATFLAQLEREGVTYEVKVVIGGWTVELTGGF